LTYLFCLAVIFLFLFSTNAEAASDLSADSQHELLQLESTYFGHSFSMDSYDARIERLEKLVFGEASTSGAPQQRMEKLVAATAGSSSGRGTSSQSSQNSQKPTTTSAMPAASNSSNGSSESYPHIAALEKEILGQTFPSAPLPERLKKMEVKAFGGASNNPDLSERTDELDYYVEHKLHKEPFTANPSAQTATSSVNTDDVNPDEYPHVTTLEKEILSQTYVDDPLPERLSRMEAKAFGSPSKSTDLSQRTDVLEKYAEKKLHKKPFEPQQSETANGSSQSQSGQSRLPQQLLSMVGNSLLGLAGFGGIGPNMGGGGLGAGGMPAGGSPGLGFSGTGINRRSQTAQQQESTVHEVEDDPAVHLATPPPTSAKMLTKVGWCEVQVFGHTFPEMHLEERLRQLNLALEFKPGATNMELLDDVGPMIKTVQVRNKATASK
jgi:hypothetical protein